MNVAPRRTATGVAGCGLDWEGGWEFVCVWAMWDAQDLAKQPRHTFASGSVAILNVD